MFAKDREAMRLTPAEVRLILIESLQWCANNAVYFLGLIGAATYDLAGTAFWSPLLRSYATLRRRWAIWCRARSSTVLVRAVRRL